MVWEGFRQGTGFVGVGVSGDDKMGNDFLFICSQVFFFVARVNLYRLLSGILVNSLLMKKREKLECTANLHTLGWIEEVHQT